MLWEVNGKVYTESEGKHPFAEVEMRIEDGAKVLKTKAGGVDTLPVTAFPLTYTEALVRMTPVEPAKKRKKVGDTDEKTADA